jgi:hypothetical protein
MSLNNVQSWMPAAGIYPLSNAADTGTTYKLNEIIRITGNKGLHWRMTGHMDSKPADYGIEIYNHSGSVFIEALGNDLLDCLTRALDLLTKV